VFDAFRSLPHDRWKRYLSADDCDRIAKYLRSRLQPRTVSREGWLRVEDYLIDTYGDTRSGAKEIARAIAEALGLTIDPEEEP
jgi:hypothetical protein